MKIKLLSAFLLTSFAFFAQQNETKKIVKIQGNDTTIIMIKSRVDQMDSLLTEEMKKVYINDSMVTRVDVFIDTFITKDISTNNADSTQIKIGNMKIVILGTKTDKGTAEFRALEGEPSNGQRKIIIDEKVIIENDEDFTWTPKNGEAELELGQSEDQHAVWSGLGINANGFVNSSMDFATAEQLGFLALDPAKSLGIQFNFAQKRFPIIHEYLGVVTGLGVQWNRYALKGAYDLSVVNDTLVGIATGLNYAKNVLTSTYLQAPLLLQISTAKDPNTAWHISAGIVGGLRLAARQTQKWEADGKKNKDKTKDDFQFNPFQASLMAVVGYGDWSLYATYGLSDVFNQGSALKARGVNAGILLSF
jgi:hypothetical protein